MTLEQSNIVCPTCGSPDHMHHLVGANVGYWDMKCFNCNSYFNFDELFKHRIAEVIKPKTNADRIRSMTDAELATFLSEYGDCPCIGDKFCKLGTRCEDAVLMWLKRGSEGEQWQS